MQRANSSISRHLKPQETIAVHLKAEESVALHPRTQEILTPCFAQPDRTRSPRLHDQGHENGDAKICQAQSPPPDFDAFFLPEHQNNETDGFDRRRDVIHSELTDHMLSGTLLAQEAQDLSDNLISTSSHEVMRGSAALGTMEDAVGKQGTGVLQQWSNFWPPMLP